MRSLGLCTAVFFVLWLLVVFLTSPNELGIVAFVLFYTLFFLTVTGICGLAFMYLASKARRAGSAPDSVTTAARQGILIGILLTATLLLQQFNFFAWWVGLLVLGAVFLVELYFLSRSK